MIIIIQDILVIVFLFLFGLIISPLLIIAGLKLPKKESMGLCPNCENKYTLFELMPILPYVLNYGYCPYCNYKISFLYPLAELMTGIVYSLSFIIYGFSYEMITLILVFSLLVILYISDFKYYVIQSRILIFFVIISLILKELYFGTKIFLLSLAGGLIVFVFLWLVKIVGDKVFKVESLGGGDVKLSFYFGTLLGVRLGIVSLVIGAFLAFPYALYYAITKKEKEIPFGPFLITALLIVFVFMEPIRNFLVLIFTNY